ncbi:MAG: 50S ribosomal protein L31 [SAR324 cluster bacterium]|nr:50S ribosomal protein L31 [SAR324 cluster bacterium]
MKTAIHPDSRLTKYTCACGNKFSINSTHSADVQIDICPNCHPLFTGKEKLVDTAGQVEKFRKRFAKMESLHITKKSDTADLKPESKTKASPKSKVVEAKPASKAKAIPEPKEAEAKPASKAKASPKSKVVEAKPASKAKAIPEPKEAEAKPVSKAKAIPKAKVSSEKEQ